MLLYAGLAAAPAAAAAGDLAVTPVRLSLSPRQSVATMSVRNTGSDPTTLQMRVFAWSQKDGEDVLAPTQDVLANPGGFDLAPGASQLARFGLRTPASPVEKSYRVILQEVPRKDTAKPNQIATLLRISLPVFVEAPGARVDATWRLRRQVGGDLALDVVNSGGAHVQITRISLTTVQGGLVADQPVSAYVLAGAHGQIALRPSHPVAVGEQLVLKAQTDGRDLTASLRAEAAPGDMASR